MTSKRRQIISFGALGLAGGSREHGLISGAARSHIPMWGVAIEAAIEAAWKVKIAPLGGLAVWP
jgi:hypothetical protein